MLCINMLLEKLSVLEELRAIHCVILHTGDTLYDCERMDDFLVDLKARVDQLTETSSCVNEPCVQQQAQALYQVSPPYPGPATADLDDLRRTLSASCARGRSRARRLP